MELHKELLNHLPNKNIDISISFPKEDIPNLEKNIYEYLPNNIKKLNKLLFDIDVAKYEVEEGDTNSLCNISGVCEVNKEDLNREVGSCYFCGTELIKHSNGDWYHYSAYDDKGILKDEGYQTHNNYGASYPDHTSEEQRTLSKLKEKLKEFLLLEFKEQS